MEKKVRQLPRESMTDFEKEKNVWRHTEGVFVFSFLASTFVTVRVVVILPVRTGI